MTNSVTVTSSVIPILRGGTGARYSPNARKNLGYLGMFLSEANFENDESIIIPNNADLNTPTYCATGKYSCSSDNKASTIQNCPSTSAFILLVYNIVSSNTGGMKENVWDYRVRMIINYSGDIFIQQVLKSSSNSYTYYTWRKVVT